MMKLLKCTPLVFITLFLFSPNFVLAAEEERDIPSRIPVSPQTQGCIGCHVIYTPGIVSDWLTSRHAKITPAEGLKKPPLERRLSATNLPQALLGYAVGCYECHGLNPASHRDNFKHMGNSINVVVTPSDCKTCHPVEASQFEGSKKSYAYKDLMENSVYHMLVGTITGVSRIDNRKTATDKPSEMTLHETCLGCHGTKVDSDGMKTIVTKLGKIEIPNLTNWPNQGVGRVNPDGSRGSCSACHARHAFSIGMARKPYTCSQCHLEPDVPAWNVYEESKHGDILFSKYQEWNFDSVPWIIGKDFKAPSCATCHNSLLVSSSGDIVAERTHDFGSRLWVRLFGLIYSHPQPKSGDTTIIRNKDGLPLPVTFTDQPASEYLIDKTEQDKRLRAFENICNGCHSTQWIEGHFAKLDNTVKETDEMTLAATKLITEAWEEGMEDKTNPFDEALEKMWAGQWLFYSNSVRYASAMTGAPDYTSFKNGWWYMSENLQHMKDWLELRTQAKEKHR
jgi:hydroxylamine dehydrogenase